MAPADDDGSTAAMEQLAVAGKDGELVLHHYPGSPYAFKILLALGLKGLPFRSVLVPAMPPRAATQPLSGGYRRIPILQIGSTIYCDTALILDELEARFPNAPSLVPVDPATGHADWMLVDAAAAWCDKLFFPVAANLLPMHLLPARFVADRYEMMTGRKPPPKPKQPSAAAPAAAAAPRPAPPPARTAHLRAQAAGLLQSLAAALSASPTGWLHAQRAPTLADVHAAMNVWFLFANPVERDPLLLKPDDDPAAAAAAAVVTGWMDRLHDAAAAAAAAAQPPPVSSAKSAWPRGAPERASLMARATPMDEAAALALARRFPPPAASSSSPSSSFGLLVPPGVRAGAEVTVVPDDYGKVAVRGVVEGVWGGSATGGGRRVARIAVRQRDTATGVETIVHFPLRGYVVAPVAASGGSKL
ncbi:hypothetical protein DFJ73DRAFT_802507 [Zopfochytrium polystomum]|nr:hypothetical protein DFJ73DRAFT_802507 [Zopfochytrium polystomum]